MINEKIPMKIYYLIDDEYISIITPIITNKEFLLRRDYHHHENRSVYMHCLFVSLRAYHIAKKLGLDYHSIAIGALLHDFYYQDWQANKIKKPLLQSHGFVHAKEAVANAKKNFPELINKKVENVIKRHMFPLNIIPPFYLESWIVCFVDKYCACEIFKTPSKLYKYIGISKRK